MKAQTIIVCFLALCIVNAAFAQDKPALEELLRWFPPGDYSEISHFDLEEFVSTCPEELAEDYARTGRRLFPAGEGCLPSAMVNRFESETKAYMGKAQIINCYTIAESGEIERVNRKCAVAFEADDKYYGAWLSRERLIAYRFADCSTLVKEALAKGQIEALEVRIDGLPVYTYRADSNNSLLFGYATTTQDFLVAGNLDDLKSMVLAGRRNALPISLSIDLSGLLEHSNDPGYVWCYRNRVLLYRILVDYLGAKDPKSPSIASLENQMEDDVQYSLDDYRWDSDGNHLQRTILHFGEREKAAEEYRLMDQGSGHYYEAMQNVYIFGRKLSFRDLVRRINLARNNASISLDGNRIIVSRTDDMEILVNVLKAYESFQQEAETRKPVRK